MWDKKPGVWYLWEMRNDFYELRNRCNIFKKGGPRPGLTREPVCCYCKFFSSSLERIARLHWTNLGNHIYLYLFTRGNYSLTGSPLTRLEAPFPLAFKGSNMAGTQWRAFHCSMNQQDTLTAHDRDIFHKSGSAQRRRTACVGNVWAESAALWKTKKIICCPVVWQN